MRSSLLRGERPLVHLDSYAGTMCPAVSGSSASSSLRYPCSPFSYPYPYPLSSRGPPSILPLRPSLLTLYDCLYSPSSGLYLFLTACRFSQIL